MVQSSVMPVLLVAFFALGVMAFAGLSANTTGLFSTSTFSKGLSDVVFLESSVELSEYSSKEQYDVCVLAREIEGLAQAQQMQTSVDFSALKSRWKC